MPETAVRDALAAAVASGFQRSSELTLSELRMAVASMNPEALREAVRLLLGADRVFVAGAGRSRLALSMRAMSLMHFGLAVHMVGDTMSRGHPASASRAGNALRP